MTKRFDYQSFYDRIASIYELGARLWLGYSARGLPWLPASGRILEIGHGPGLLLPRLARDDRVFGLDLSWEMIRRARRRSARAGIRALLTQGDATHLPFESASFDGILITFAFSAIPDGAGAMAEMARVLRPSGRLVLVDAGVPDDHNRMAVFLARLWERFGDHMRDEVLLMQVAGLRVIHREEFGPWRCMRVVVGEKAPAAANDDIHHGRPAQSSDALDR